MKHEKVPFRDYELDQDKLKPDIFTIRLNKDERVDLENDKKVLNQKKDSTAIKTLAEIGRNVLHDQKTGLILRSIFKNKALNKLSGIVDFED